MTAPVSCPNRSGRSALSSPGLLAVVVLATVFIPQLVAAQVTLFEHRDFRGQGQTFDHDVRQLKGSLVGNDRASSVTLGRGCHVTLFEHKDFRGRSTTLSWDEPNLRSTFVGNDAVSSLLVDCGSSHASWRERRRGGSWQERQAVWLFADKNFRGREIGVSHDVPHLGRTPLGNDTLSSLHVPHGCRALLYEHRDFRGRVWEVWESIDNLKHTPIPNDRISSVAVDCR